MGEGGRKGRWSSSRLAGGEINGGKRHWGGTRKREKGCGGVHDRKGKRGEKKRENDRWASFGGS